MPASSRSFSPWILLPALLLGSTLWAAAADTTPASDPAEKPDTTGTAAGKSDTAATTPGSVEEGHSAHGEVFNEGPRQAAYLMAGTGNVHFPATCKTPEVQQFIDQGVGQLHGFWYFESERSFRQAAALDPECAIAYWGMAMSNRDNEKRARGFMDEAVKHKGKATTREQRYIDAWATFFKEPDKAKKEDKDREKNRRQALVKAYENILHEFPDDLEAKAFLSLAIYENKAKGIPISSYFATDALMRDVLDVNPMHPVHHFRIHLWDYEKPERALDSAALCGTSAPAIAHMWHMPGHTYSRLHRYHDAVWQQEASARVDHAHMMRDRVLPDQIHNFAHNNEWLIRNLIHIGDSQRAMDLAQNMCDLPRHPKYNTGEKKGSAYYGRLRLFEVLEEFELWKDALRLVETRYLEPTEKVDEQRKRTRLQALANFRLGRIDEGTALLNEVREQLAKVTADELAAVTEAEEKVRQKHQPGKEAKDASPPAVPVAEASDKKEGCEDNKPADDAEPADKPDSVEADTKSEEKKDNKPEDDPLKKELKAAADKARKTFATDKRQLEQLQHELEGHAAMAKEDYPAALEQFKKVSRLPKWMLAEAQWLAGEKDKALTTLRNDLKDGKGEVLPLARLIPRLWESDKQDEAKAKFEELRAISAKATLSQRPFQPLAPIAQTLEYPEDWRLPFTHPADFGERPALDALGPFRWSPSTAPEWELLDHLGKPHRLADYKGRPVVVIFYLGYGCLHCAQQLQAFGPMTEEFRKAGIDLIAISTDPMVDLKSSHENYDKGEFPFPLVSNADLDIFKKYRCYDDFEKDTLHGTFVIDPQGKIRWQDISYEPFMDAKFVLGEAQRLLQLDAATTAEQPAAVSRRTP